MSDGISRFQGEFVGDGCATGQVRSDCVSCVVDAVAVDSDVGESYDGGGEGEACC